MDFLVDRGRPVAFVAATLATAHYGDAALYPPQPGSPRVEVFVASNIYHSGIVLPRDAMSRPPAGANCRRWRRSLRGSMNIPRLEFGWGDEGFYTRVPTTNELTTALALVRCRGRAIRRCSMWSGSSSLRARPIRMPAWSRLRSGRPASSASPARSMRPSRVPRWRYRRAWPRPRAEPVLPGGRRFPPFRVCNHWIADLLDAAGVPTAPVLATMPQGSLWDLTWRAGAVRLPLPAQ